MTEAESAPVELDDEAKALQLERLKAEARRDIAAARQDRITSALPDLDVELPRGELDVGASGSSLPELIAYRHLDEAAGGLVDKLRNDHKVQGRRILIISELDQTARCASHDALMQRATLLTGRLEEARTALPSGPRSEGTGSTKQDSSPARVTVSVAAGLAVLVGAVPTIARLLRTDTTIRPASFSVADTAVVAAVARVLRQQGAHVEVPGMRAVPENAVIEQMKRLAVLREDVADGLRRFRIEVLQGGPGGRLERLSARLASRRKALDGLLDDRGADDDSGRRLQEEVDELQDSVSGLRPVVEAHQATAATADALLEATDQFLATAYTTDAAGYSPVMSAALAHETCSGDGLALYVKASAAGGESVYEDRIGADKALHVGGFAITWMLTDCDGEVLSSGVHTHASSVNTTLGKPLDW